MIFFGRLEDRLRDKRRLLTAGYAIQTAGIAVLLWATDVRDLLIGLGVYAVGTGIVMPIWKVLYARGTQRGKEATEWGLFHGVNTLLISTAAALSGLLYALGGFRAILAMMLASHALAVAVSLGKTDTQRGR